MTDEYKSRERLFASFGDYDAQPKFMRPIAQLAIQSFCSGQGVALQFDETMRFAKEINELGKGSFGGVGFALHKWCGNDSLSAAAERN